MRSDSDARLAKLMESAKTRQIEVPEPVAA